VVIDDVVFDGGFVCSHTFGDVCGRSILLHFSFLFGGGGRFSGAVFGELWRLVSFAFGGGGTFGPLPRACFRSPDFVPVAADFVTGHCILVRWWRMSSSATNLGDGAADIRSRIHMCPRFHPGALALAVFSKLWSLSLRLAGGSHSVDGFVRQRRRRKFIAVHALIVLFSYFFAFQGLGCNVGV
jgi:hypothetical protein